MSKWRKNGNGATDGQLTWEAHVALYVSELETRLIVKVRASDRSSRARDTR